jgi:hypothetical protein
LNPVQTLRKIASVSALDSTAVEFTEHATPVPLTNLLFNPDLLPTVTKLRENGSERNELRLVRQVAV